MPEVSRSSPWLRVAGAFLREAAWLAREVVLYLVRGVALLWGRVRVGRFRAPRIRVLEGIGGEAWKAFPAPRRVEVRAAVLVLLCGALFLSYRTLRTATPVVSPVGVSQIKPHPTGRPSLEREALLKKFNRDRDAAAPGRWILFPGNPVLERGDLGAWDDFKVGSPVVMREGGPFRKRFRMWYRGCHFIGDEYTCGVGGATSRDGISWEKSPGPLLEPEDEIDRENLASIAVVRAGGRYYLWYSVDTDVQSERPAEIVLATSRDGTAWNPAGPVIRAVSPGTTHIELDAHYDGKRFHLWYVDAATPEGGQALLHVTSTDGRRWQIAGSTSLEDLGLHPGRVSVIPNEHGGYLAHFTYGRTRQADSGLFGVLLSGDGSRWKLREDGPKLRTPAFENRDVADAPAVLPEDDSLWMWFVIRPESGAEAIGTAFMKEPAP
jgi:hypothetical protein